MPKNKDIEQILLSDLTIDELIKQKISQDVIREIESAKNIKPPDAITDFSSLPTGKTFDKSAIYNVFNRKTKQESKINGIQAESIVGLQSDIRERLLSRALDCFLTDDYYVKFSAYEGE